MNTFNAGWYLIYTKPRHERKLSANLTEQKIHSFLPITRKVKNYRDRKKYIETPLFPSYIFIYLSSMQHYYAGMESGGFLYYVKTGKGIARVSDDVVNNIRLATTFAKDLEVTNNHFQPGQQLIISQGALAGLSCEVVKMNDKEKLLVRVGLLQRNILLTLSSEYFLTA